MEKIPTPENPDLSIERLLKKLESFADLFDKVSPELQEQWYWVEMEAEVAKDRTTAKAHVEEFIRVLEYVEEFIRVLETEKQRISE